MSDQHTVNSRRSFIKKGAAGLAGAVVLPSVLKGQEKEAAAKKKKERKLIYRTLGKTGLKLPIVSMGVMNADNPKLVEAALDAGMIHLDTAHVYQRGRNEEMIGKVIKGRPRDSFVLATKVPGGGMDRKTGLFTKQTDPKAFVEKFHTSLKRLGVDYVEIFYLHSVVKKEAVMYEPLLSAMVKLKKEGKVRFIGVSTHRNEPEVLRAAADSNVYDVVLSAYNFNQPHVKKMDEALAYAVKKGIGTVAMKTQAGVYWDRERTRQINMKAALKWALQNENIHTSIPGFTTFDQMELDLSVMENPALTPKEKADLKLGDKLSGLHGLYCTQCGSCQAQCPHGLDIPTMMRSYMYAYGYKSPGLAKDTLREIDLSTVPCSQCGTCGVQCTMGFDVKNKVTDIARLNNIPEEFLV
jgi:predicted aldo/keto reductase-like oxidoreductase